MQQQAPARAYTLDRSLAISGSSTGFQRISATGGYVGKFTKAKGIRASTGAEGIEFTFEADNGAEAQYLAIYTYNRAGEPVFGLDLLNAGMTCMRLREIAPEPAIIKEWHPPSSAEIDTPVQLYRTLMDKPVGLALQLEQYRKADGTVGERMRLAGFFEADTRRSAREVLADTPPAEVSDTDALLASLKDKLLQPDARRAAAPTPVATANATTATDFDDDIPF